MINSNHMRRNSYIKSEYDIKDINGTISNYNNEMQKKNDIISESSSR